jgi:preprotein translocase subunit YajC
VLYHYVHAIQEVVTAQADTPSNPLGSMFPFILMIFFLYFIMFRPQQKKEKARREMLAAIAKGDEVVTTGGICGKIIRVKDDKVQLQVSSDPTVKLDFVRSAIAYVETDEKQ